MQNLAKQFASKTNAFSAPTESAQAGSKYAVIQNPTSSQVFSWIPTSVTFAKGELSLQASATFGASDRPSESRVLKKWDDGSVAILQVKSPHFLQPGEKALQAYGPNAPMHQGFQFHNDLATYIGRGDLAFGVRLQCQSFGQTLTAYPFGGEWKVCFDGPVSKVFRFRGHFLTGMPVIEKELSYTVYAECEHLSPIVKMTVVYGNDTLEKPIAGGIEIVDFDVLCTKPGLIQHLPAYGNRDLWLADGQQLAFRFFFNCSTESVFQQTLTAWSEHELLGMQLYQQHQASKALLTHQDLPNPRFPASELLNVHNQVEAQYAAQLVAAPKAAIGFTNQNPPSTGDQGDFASGHTLTKELQSHSLRALNRAFQGVYRESFRPSHYWETRNGKKEWCSLTDYPTLFFWSGRPHWHPTWNPEYPAWQARGALNAGPMDGWGGSDNQHMSNNGLRGVFELTGDYYLGEMLQSYVSVAYWNFFTKWLPNIEAERGTRSVKEAWAVASLFRDIPEAQTLLARVVQKCQSYDQAVTQNISQWNVAGCAPFDSCDPRVNNGLWCAPYPGSTIAVAWQTGFHMEQEWLRDQPDLRYLADVDKYFLPNGTPKTYFPFPAPNDFVTGGIGIAWWSGWVMLALKYPSLPGSQFVISNLKPLIDQSINSSAQGYFSSQDRWKAWA